MDLNKAQIRFLHKLLLDYPSSTIIELEIYQFVSGTVRIREGQRTHWLFEGGMTTSAQAPQYKRPTVADGG
jgi:hypothetical protein